ncbi:hypothetical protein ACQ4LE_003672 [Meloidogyne hapla]
MPSEDFRCRPLRFLLREIFVTKIFVPLLDCLSEPFFVNRMIVWLLSELPLSTDDFVGCLERCKCVQELESILESVHEEICTLRSKGAGNGENGNTFSDQLSSLEFTEKLIRRRMIFLVNRSEPTEPTDDEKAQHQVFKQMASLKKDFGNGNFEFAEEAISLASDSDGTIHLPLGVVLANTNCLSHFIEFLNQAGGQNHIDFYLAIQGFKSSMEHQLRSTKYLDVDTLETLREAALFMYHQYLSQEAITRVPLSDSIINKFLARLRSNDAQSDFWFEQIEEKLLQTLRTETRFFPAFKKHSLYTKMLEEIGIGNNISTLPEEEEILEEDEEEIEEIKNLNKNEKYLLLNEEDENNEIKKERRKKIKKSFKKMSATTSSISSDPSTSEENSVFIEMLGVGHQGRHLFALYNVRVNKANASSNVIRRYSDFHSLHNIILSKFPNLNALSFPGKKTFNNLDRAFLEKRCYALNQYINYVLQPNVLSENPGLEKLIFDFLSQKTYSGKESFNPKAMGKAMFNPIFRGVRAFGSAAAAVPSDLIDGIGKMGSELNRAASQILGGTSDRQRAIRNQRLYSADSTGSLPESSRVAAHLDEKDSDNIPLRVLLLFVDEVFGLRAKNQWFRRRLVSLLRQFVNATMGNSINRRIVDAVNWLTSEEQVAQYLIAMRDSIWGNNDSSNSNGGGFFTDRQSQTSNNNRQNNNTNTNNNPQDGRQRTRFLARCLMLSAIPDQLRLFIGNTTIQLGIENVSEALQNKHLNRRFWYLIFERLLTTIFPNNRFDRLLPQLHSKSPRAQNKAAM